MAPRAGPSVSASGPFSRNQTDSRLPEPKVNPTAGDNSGRAKTILEILRRKKALRAAKERHHDPLRYRALVASEQIRLGVTRKSQLRRAERKVIFKHWRKVSAGAIQIEAKQERSISLSQSQPEEMFRNYVLRLHSPRRHETVAVRVGVRRAPFATAPGRGLDVSLDAAGNAARLIDITAKPSQAERVNNETLERNHALQARIEIRRPKPRAVACHPLIEPGRDAN